MKFLQNFIKGRKSTLNKKNSSERRLTSAEQVRIELEYQYHTDTLTQAFFPNWREDYK